MTQNDQAAMNEQLTELRLNGLSIDGDNRYKQDLIDAIIGAMMFGAQGANPPPAGHWLEQFYVIVREERQALARVEAERDALKAENAELAGSIELEDASNHYREQQLKAQLADVLYILDQHRTWTGMGWEQLPVPVHAVEKIRRKVAQAEQQDDGRTCRFCQKRFGSAGECGNHVDQFHHGEAEQQEAQGAQAEPANFDQELEAFEKWRHTQADSLRRCGYPDGADAFIRLGSVQWAGWQARAALATQPAAGEPVAWMIDWPDEPELGHYLSESPDATTGSRSLPLFTAAPPAAAHGDEAVRKDAEYFRFIESCPIRTGVVLSRKAHEAGFDLRAECERVMAMRAQGDGEVQ